MEHRAGYYRNDGASSRLDLTARRAPADCDAVAAALVALDAVFDEFEHVRVLTEAQAADEGGTETQAVMFRARIGDQVIEGLDVLEVNRDDKITTFTAFARPLAALQALGQALARTRA
jgi:hypothetical protein